MILYPAIDLMGGAVVRLRQGQFDAATTYASDPETALADFAAAGAQWAHIVDLDGARAGAPVQHALIVGLARGAAVKLQVGGGFRTREQVAAMLDAGVARVVIGSLAVRDPEMVRELIAGFGPDRIALSLDVHVADRMPMVAVSGWAEASGLSLWQAAALVPEARHLLLTDIGRDGMLAGPNVPLLEEAVARLPHLAVQASGGIAALSDFAALPTAGVVVGKALWEGRFTLAEAIDACA